MTLNLTKLGRPHVPTLYTTVVIIVVIVVMYHFLAGRSRRRG